MRVAMHATNVNLAAVADDKVREFAARLLVELRHRQARIEKLTHQVAILRRLRYARKSEEFSGEQKSLPAEATDEDLEALAREIEREKPAPRTTAPETDKQQPKRQALPAHLPRRQLRHEPETSVCGCGGALKRIGEDVAEKLHDMPGVFSVKRHIRGKWV